MSGLRSWLLGLALLVPSVSLAQEVNFDAACPAPPCNVGTLFSASGVNFSPNTSQIRGATIDGLTGTKGGSYLRVAAFPYQQTITLSRPATFVTFDLSRATSSSGALSVQVTALLGAAPVGSTTVTLTTVDTWTNVRFTIPGGFDSIFIDPSGGANNTFGLDNLLFGGTCNGFSDVAPSDSFCNASEWLANRLVTLGCAAGMYCPGTDVNRAQMALFMNRLGNALTPVIVSVTGGGSAVDLDATPQLCETSDFAPVNYDRTAVVNATVAGDAAGALEFQQILRFSFDGGLTWQLVSGNFSRGATSSAIWVNSAMNGSATMLAGRTYRFAIEVDRQSGTADFVNYRCFITVTAFSRSGTSAPFDPAPAAQDDGAKR